MRTFKLLARLLVKSVGFSLALCSAGMADMCYVTNTTATPIPIQIAGCTFSGSLPNGATNYWNYPSTGTLVAPGFDDTGLSNTIVAANSVGVFVSTASPWPTIVAVQADTGTLSTSTSSLQSQINALSAGGVSAINSSGNPNITGNVTFLGGSNVTLSQAGSTITVASSGGGGGGSSVLATALNGVQITSPTIGINVLSPLVNNAVGSTATFSVDLSTTANKANVATSTAAIATSTAAIAVDTGTIFTRLVAVGVSTGSIAVSTGQLSASTVTIQTQVNSIAVSTGQLSVSTAAIAVSTGILTTSTNTLQSLINGKVGLSTFTAVNPVFYDNATGIFTLGLINGATGINGIIPPANVVSTTAYTNSTQTWTAGQTFTTVVATTITVSTITVNSSFTVNNISSITLSNVVLQVSTVTWSPSVTFTTLQTAPNGTVEFCSDCTVATPATCSTALLASCVCAGSGSGAFAKRINATWYCQ